jgi:hypothetical protein
MWHAYAASVGFDALHPVSAHQGSPQTPSVRLLPQQSDSVGLVVISEEDTRTLLIHRISREDIYQRQGGGWSLRSQTC